jgi:RHS repeat-associated protein
MPLSRGTRKPPHLFALAVPVALLLFGIGDPWSRHSPPLEHSRGHSTVRSVVDTIRVYGPNTFATENGSSQLHIERFKLDPVQGAVYTMQVEFGSKEGDPRPTGAVVRLNGMPVVNLADISAEPAATYSVTPDTVNTLEITVEGPAGASLTVAVYRNPLPEFTVFGPERFMASNGVEARRFSIPSTAAPPYRLYAESGSDGGDQPPRGSVRLNGTEVLSANDFSTIAETARRSVGLLAENLLEVGVTGDAGAFVSLRITASDVTPPDLEITVPKPGARVATAEVIVGGRIMDETPVHMTVNGLHVPVADGAFEIAVPLPSEGPNTIEIVAIDAAGHRVVETITVYRDTQGPHLEVTEPLDRMVTNAASITVAGQTDAGALVTVNGRTIDPDPSGHFESDIPVGLGSNVLMIIARDDIGHVTAQTRTVLRTYGLRTDQLTLASEDPAAGYVAWFKANAIAGLNDGDPVGTWDDSGPNNKDATQSTASLKPVYKTNLVGGLPAVRFDGSDDRLVSPAGSGMWGLTNHFTVFAVVRLDASPGTGSHDVVGSSNLSNNLDLIARRDNANGNWVAYNSSPDGTRNSNLVLSTDTWYVITWRLRANSPKHLQIRVDKEYRLNDTGYTGIGTAPSTAALGARQNGLNPLKGDIAEVIFYTESLSDADMETTEDYLLSKYGLDSGGPPPTPNPPSGLTATATSAQQVDLAWTDNSSDETGFRVERRLGQAGTFGTLVHVGAGVVEHNDMTVAEETEYCYRVIAFNANGDSSPSNVACATTPALDLPPDPEDVAPEIDPSTVTLLADAIEFLYTGADSIQTGVAPGTIEVRQAAVVRGLVVSSSGSPVTGAEVSILDHPELGQTLSRADGAYDLVVNGGGPLTVAYRKGGYVPAQRTVDVPWQNWVIVDDVTLLQPDSLATVIDFADPMQVARGTTRSDEDGSRQATILFPQNAGPALVMPDGSTDPISTLTIRATEFTVGEDGPGAMPAGLPPTSAYTYAADIRVEEAQAAGAVGIEFDHPIRFYVDNFLDFPVGMTVPMGRYDYQGSSWVPEENGRVIKIVGMSGGLADLDIDGDGNAEDAATLAALGIDQPEREELAALYVSGTELWRAPLDHLSPIDGNWPFGAGPGEGGSGRGSGGNPGDGGDPDNPGTPGSDPCTSSGSIIECQNQILGERIPLVGTPFTLDYRSDRTRGHEIGYTLNIPLTIDSVPADLKRVELEIYVAGRTFADTFPALPNQSTTFTWDGLDAYGRELQGTQPVRVRIGFVYPFYYGVPASVAQSFGLTCTDPPGGLREACIIPTSLNSDARQEASLDYIWEGSIGAWRATAAGLGGWTLSAHHAYDPYSRTLHYGDGRRRSDPVPSTRIITHIAGKPQGTGGDGGPATEAQFWDIPSIAVAPDGSYYLSDKRSHVVRRVGPDGIIDRYAGKILDDGFSGDSGPARSAELNDPTGIALGPDGTLYIVDSDNFRIRAVAPDSTITSFAGTGVEGSTGDGGPATAAQIDPWDVAVGPDGSVYISEYGRHRVRRVGLDGIITTVAGTGVSGSSGDGDLAVDAKLSFPKGIDVGSDGSLYIADHANHRIRRVDRNGVIVTVAGQVTATGGFSGDGGPAIDAELKFPVEVSVDPSEGLFIGDEGNRRVRFVDGEGNISTFAGSGNDLDGNPGYSGDGGYAPAAKLSWPTGLDVGPDGALYIADDLKRRVRKVNRLLTEVTGDDFQIASEDGIEIYEFDASGRHLRTRHGLTGANLYTFAYDALGQLASMTDGAGNVTTIERDGTGKPTAIEAPFGQLTELTLNANGYLSSVTNPADESITLSYYADGLLASFTDPRSNETTFQYDSTGRLIADEDAAGGSVELDRTEFDNGFEVAKTSGLGRNKTYLTEDLPDGGQRRENTDATELVTETILGTDGTTTITHPDGTVVNVKEGPDPRFDSHAPILEEATVVTPDGLEADVSGFRTTTLSDPSDPLTLVSQTDSLVVNGRVFKNTFAAASRTFTATTPEGRVFIGVIDSLGRVTKDSISGLAAVRYNYDALGRLSQVAQGTRTWQYGYDSSGRIASLTDPLGRVDSLDYDVADRVTQQVFPDGREVVFGYDAAGNLASVTPPGRPAHGFAYTDVNLTSSYAPPDLGPGLESTTYSYNLDRQLTRILRPDSLAIDFGYDTGGRPATITIPGGQLSYQYNVTTGMLTSISATDSLTSDLSFTYDGSLLRTSTWSGPVAGSVAVGYDDDFRVSSLSVNGADTTAFEYDQDGLLVEAGTLTVSRDPTNGLVTATTLGNVTTSTSHSTLGEWSQHLAQVSGSDLFRTSYTRDGLGRITRLTEIVQGDTTVYDYSYNLSGRLTEVETNDVVTATYGYDSNGNRTSFTGSGGTVAGTYDAQDRLLTYGSASYSYTPNGELERKIEGSDTTHYSYDVLGNLKAMALPDGTEIEFVVDGLNRRVGKKINGALVKGWLYEGQLNPVAEVDGGGQVIARFVYGTRLNVPEYMVKDGTTYRIVADHLGSVRLVVNVSTGAVVQRIDYDAFGVIIQDTNPEFQPFGFAGGLNEQASGLIRFGVRDFDPASGRWTAKDPAFFGIGVASLYEYSTADPVNVTDPTGLIPLPGCLIDFFSTIFPELNLERVHLHDDTPWLSPTPYDGLTVGNHIYIAPPFDPNSRYHVLLIGHELVHVYQYNKDGRSYILEYLRERLSSKPYREITYERQAYHFSDHTTPENDSDLEHILDGSPCNDKDQGC